MSVARCRYEVFVERPEPFEIEDDDLKEALSEVVRLSRVQRASGADRFVAPRWSAPSREGALSRLRSPRPLDGEVASAVGRAPVLYAIDVELEDPDDLGYLHAALSVAHEAISQRGGVLVDRDADIAYTAEQLASLLEDGPAVRDMVSIEEEPAGEHVRLRTRGMQKWWQTDFALDTVPRDLAELGRRLLWDTLCDYASSHGTIEGDQTLQYDRNDPAAKLFFAERGDTLVVTDCDPDDKQPLSGIAKFLEVAMPAFRAHRETEVVEAQIGEGNLEGAIAAAKASDDPAALLAVATLTAQHAADRLGEALAAIDDATLASAPPAAVGDLVATVAQAADVETLRGLVSRLPREPALIPPLVAASSRLESDESLTILDWVRTLPEPPKGADEREAWVQAWVNSCVDARSLDDTARKRAIAEAAEKYGAEDARIHHLAACIHAACGNPDRAVEQVGRAAELDYDMEQVADDAELESIAGRPDFQKIVASFRARRDARAARVTLVNDDSFEDVVLGASLPVLVDFWADWCGPCHAIAPVVAQLAEQYEGRARFVKVDVDENEGLAERFEIQSIPTLILFHEGRVVDRVSGAVPKAALETLLSKALA